MFKLLFGTFDKGDKVEATFIPGYYKVGTKKPVTIAGTLENVRTVNGRTYVAILQENKEVIELKDEDLQNLKKAAVAETKKVK